MCVDELELLTLELRIDEHDSRSRIEQSSQKGAQLYVSSSSSQQSNTSGEIESKKAVRSNISELREVEDEDQSTK